MASERTERATPRRRQEARRQGQVARSADLTSALGLLAVGLFLPWYGAYAFDHVSRYLQGAFSRLPREDLTTASLAQLGWDAGSVFFRITLPLLGLMLLTGVASTLAQVGVVFAPAALKPDLKRIDPVAGFQRILSRRGAFETAKAVIKIVQTKRGIRHSDMPGARIVTMVTTRFTEPTMLPIPATSRASDQ